MRADSERVTEQQSLSPHSMKKDTTKINVFIDISPCSLFI